MLVDAPHCPPIVSVDWLALSCCLAHPYDGAPFEVPNGWTVLTMGETPAWLKRFFIMDELGNKVATILTEPRMASMDRRRALVEIANRWLYHPALEAYVDAVLTSYPMAVDGVNRVDLRGSDVETYGGLPTAPSVSLISWLGVAGIAPSSGNSITSGRNFTRVARPTPPSPTLRTCGERREWMRNPYGGWRSL